ncbi:MAG TPA: MFS transporter [Acidobacteriaceae bacterium]|nr:MFS transporter [Acidobacteriaceae bacterium]
MADAASPNASLASAALAFRSRDFRRYQMARFVAIIGAEAQSVAVAWQVYQLTHSAKMLGFTGLALFLPGLFCVLPAGHTADRYDRRLLILACYALQTAASGLLFWFSYYGTRHILSIYAVLFLIGIGRAFSGPASSALVPQLVPKEHFVNAVTWGATTFQTANATGPAIGGILFTLPLSGYLASLRGAPVVFLFTVICMLTFIGLIASLHIRPGVADSRAISMQTVLAGLHYVWGAKLLLGSISLDLFAVLLGGAVNLMPIFASDILHCGPSGLGMLRAAPSLGALLVSLTLVFFPIKRHAGALMLTCVGIFGMSTICFGLARSLPLALFALFIVGASDMISVVVRSSLLQLATPPEMRGRVSAVNWLFIGASNEFGEFESGMTASWWGAVRAVVIGGIGSLMVTGTWAILFPKLRRADKLTAESLLAASVAENSQQPVD